MKDPQLTFSFGTTWTDEGIDIVRRSKTTPMIFPESKRLEGWSVVAMKPPVGADLVFEIRTKEYKDNRKYSALITTVRLPDGSANCSGAFAAPFVVPAGVAVYAKCVQVGSKEPGQSVTVQIY